MIKILLQLHNDLAVIKIIIQHLSAELALWVRYVKGRKALEGRDHLYIGDIETSGNLFCKLMGRI